MLFVTFDEAVFTAAAGFTPPVYMEISALSTSLRTSAYGPITEPDVAGVLAPRLISL